MYTEVIVQRIAAGRMAELTGHAYDISEGGLRVELDGRLEIGEHVNLTLILPGYSDHDLDGVIHLGCETVWLNDEIDDPIMPRTALRIVKYLSDDSRDRLLRFLGSRLAGRAA